MKFTIEIACENAAFGPDDIDLCQEVRRCLTAAPSASPLIHAPGIEPTSPGVRAMA